MKVENLCDYPVHLGDGRMIGASGTPEAVREYSEARLSDSDKERERRNLLRVVAEAAPTADTQAGKIQNDKKGEK